MDNSGTPCLKIFISGPFNPDQEFDAIIDTGFSGFLSIPLVKAFPLGLVLYGTTAVTLADGSSSFKLTAQALVTCGQEKEVGIAILEPSSSEVLLGMEFLRTFNRVLFVHPAKPIVTLMEQSVIDAILPPPATPPTTPVTNTQPIDPLASASGPDDHTA